jgi:hypothetical protein
MCVFVVRGDMVRLPHCVYTRQSWTACVRMHCFYTYYV